MTFTPCHVIGNWKMNGSREFAERLIDELRLKLVGLNAVEVAICPPFTLLASAAERLAGSILALGAQDMSAAEEGAYTGDISARMLRDWGVSKVILGHSERRLGHGETSAMVLSKVQQALRHGLQPVICLGETTEQRAQGRAEQVVSEQLAPLLAVLDRQDWQKCLLAYEPVWAIGTGETATPEQAQDMHAMIRAQVGRSIPLLYGGSVKAANALELFAQTDIDGGLIGGASLEADEFIAICQAANQSKVG